MGYVEDFLRVENEVDGHFQQPLFGDRDELSDPGSKTSRIPALYIDESWPSEPADKPLARGEAGHPTRGGLFDIVGGRRGPGHQVAIVDNIFLVGL